MHNDAYGGASHGPDVSFTVPVYYDDELVGFSVTTAHHLDIGALAPGSCGIVEAVESQTHRWVVGVQWHPERLEVEHPGFAAYSRRLFEGFVAAAAVVE